MPPIFFFLLKYVSKKIHLVGYLKPSCPIHCTSNYLQQQMAALHPIAKWLTLMFVLDSVLWLNSWLEKVKCPFAYMKGWKMCMGMQQWMSALLDDGLVAVKKLLWFSSYVIEFEFSWKVKEKENRRHYLLTDPRIFNSYCLRYIHIMRNFIVCTVHLI